MIRRNIALKKYVIPQYRLLNDGQGCGLKSTMKLIYIIAKSMTILLKS